VAATEEKDDDDERPSTASSSSSSTYEAHLAETVRNVKMLSMASLAATLCGTPLLLELASPDLASGAKLTICAVVDGFGVFTTALLQWFVSPYVLRMRVTDGGGGGGGGDRGDDRGDDVIAVDKLTLLGFTFTETFRASDMREADTMRPLVTWQANGKLHYVEMANVPKALYDRLDLERFDAQAAAEKHSRSEAERRRRAGDRDDDDDDDD
jgi:hypothetical protein